MKHKLLAIASAAIVIVACDGLPGEGNGNPLTPEENRARLEQTGLAALELADPAKQKDLLETIDAFYVVAQDFAQDEPETGAQPDPAVDAFLQPLKQFCLHSDPYAITAMTSENSDIYRAEDYYGIYTHNGTDAWTKEESTEKLEYRFTMEGEQVIITVAGSGEQFSYTYEEDYDGSTYYTTVELPANIKGSVTRGGKTLCTLDVKGTYNVGTDGNISQDVALMAGVYDLTAKSTLTSSKMATAISFQIEKQQVFNAELKANGENLCDPHSYIGNGNPIYNFDDITVDATVLDLKINGKCLNLGEAAKKVEAMWDEVDEKENPNELEPEGVTPYSLTQEYVSRYCKLLNDYAEITATYVGNDEPFADFRAVPLYDENTEYYDNYSYYGDYDMNGDGNIDKADSYPASILVEMPGYSESLAIRFLNDSAQFDVTEFFSEDNFVNVVKGAEALVDKYETYLVNMIGGSN